MIPLKKEYKDEDELIDEFCNRSNCHACNGIGVDGEPNGYGCNAIEVFLASNSQLIKE